MENKQTAPKEIWIHQSDVKELKTYMLASNALIHSIVKGNMDNSEYNKYLSETQVYELLAEKDREIKSLEENYDLLRNRKNGHIKVLESELTKKDREIEELKKQLQK